MKVLMATVGILIGLGSSNVWANDCYRQAYEADLLNFKGGVDSNPNASFVASLVCKNKISLSDYMEVRKFEDYQESLQIASLIKEGKFKLSDWMVLRSQDSNSYEDCIFVSELINKNKIKLADYVAIRPSVNSSEEAITAAIEMSRR